MAELAAGVLAVVDDVLVERGGAGGTFAYAGDSVGGAVGLQLLLDAPGRVSVGDPVLHRREDRRADGWAERIEQVARAARPSLVCGVGRSLVRPRLPRTASR